MDLYEELLGMIDKLTEAGMDYALCGGIAVAFHGYARFTKDIDLLLREEDVERFYELLEPRGFILRAGPIPFGGQSPQRRVIYRVSKVVGNELLTIDLLMVTPILEDVWEDRAIYEWKNRQVQIVSLEGLVKMKQLAGREQDLLDLKQLGILSDEESNKA